MMSTNTLGNPKRIAPLIPSSGGLSMARSIFSKLAFKYISVPATSVPSDWVFSSAGEVICKKRTKRADENARMLVCLHACSDSSFGFKEFFALKKCY